jgi:hypothetical protein
MDFGGKKKTPREMRCAHADGTTGARIAAEIPEPPPFVLLS